MADILEGIVLDRAVVLLEVVPAKLDEFLTILDELAGGFPDHQGGHLEQFYLHGVAIGRCTEALLSRQAQSPAKDAKRGKTIYDGCFASYNWQAGQGHVPTTDPQLQLQAKADLCGQYESPDTHLRRRLAGQT